jgi:hypothetical protein
MITGDAASKAYFAGQARLAATNFVNALDNLSQLQATYAARGYGASGTDPIADTDVAGAKITALQLTQLLESAWLVSRLLNLMGQQTVSGTIDGNGILGKIRSDM